MYFMLYDVSMRFDVITIFPKIFSAKGGSTSDGDSYGYFGHSIIKRAVQKRLISIHTHDLRAYTRDKHKKADNPPYGGGAGMVLMAEPVIRAVDAVTRKKKNEKTKIVLFSAKGRSFNQKIAYDWSKKYDRIVFVTGRYEGIDERAAQILKKEYKKNFEELSIGPYVLTDGDVASMVVVSTIARLIPGVIRTESLEEESHWSSLLKNEPKKLRAAHYTLHAEYPHYTRPEVMRYKGKNYPVPGVLISGDHKKIEIWRTSHRS